MLVALTRPSTPQLLAAFPKIPALLPKLHSRKYYLRTKIRKCESLHLNEVQRLTLGAWIYPLVVLTASSCGACSVSGGNCLYSPSNRGTYLRYLVRLKRVPLPA